MEDNVLRLIDIDETLVFYTEHQYSIENREKFLKVFQQMHDDGKIRSNYGEQIWICSSDIKTFEIDFNYMEYEYKTHIGKELGISIGKMTDMLKCYCIYICGEFIFRTIGTKIKSIREFLVRFQDRDYKVKNNEYITIIDFLNFIGTPEYQVMRIVDQIPYVMTSKAKQRELSHLINYMAVENELTDMYDVCTISNEEFLYWFPIYFWAKVTFILPLRATEMLVTPYDCLEYRNNQIFLNVRRTMLKKGQRRVYYDIDKDYKIFCYRIPETDVVRNIEKYKRLTGLHQRRFLFDYSKYSINNILSLQSFNGLLAEFVENRLIGNSKYDYSRFASGIKEFDVITAGDSRPIAMANLFYQDIGADICRQLADHTNISVSAGYYTNVGNTVLASSVMHLQRMLNQGYNPLQNQGANALQDNSSCQSPRQPKKTGNITDCQESGCIGECFDCPHNEPSVAELNKEMEERKQELERASKRIIECMAKGKDIIDQLDKYFLDAHTGIARYKSACDKKAREELKTWQRHKPMERTCL